MRLVEKNDVLPTKHYTFGDPESRVYRIRRKQIKENARMYQMISVVVPTAQVQVENE